MEENEVELIDIIEVFWKKKWLILIPTFILTVLAVVFCYVATPKWEVDSIIQPSRFFQQTGSGQFIEVVALHPQQIVGQINQGSYNRLIANDLGININRFPKVKANNLKDTSLILVSFKYSDVKRAKEIHRKLFSILKKEFDKRIEVETASIDTEILSKEYEIAQKELNAKDINNEISFQKYEKNKSRQMITSLEKKISISAKREKNIIVEQGEVQRRLKSFEEQQMKVLDKNKNADNSLNLLLYSNIIQQLLAYYGSLSENLNLERITSQEYFLEKKREEENIKQIETRVDTLLNKISIIKNEIKEINNEISLLKTKKQRIDYAQLVKEPTSTISPVYPQKKSIIILTALIAFVFFTLGAFFLEYLQKQTR